MTIGKRWQGQPLAALLGLFAVWIGVRAILWQSPLLPFDDKVGSAAQGAGSARAHRAPVLFGETGGRSLSNSPAKAATIARRLRRSGAGPDLVLERVAEPFSTSTAAPETVTPVPSLHLMPADVRSARETSARLSVLAPSSQRPGLAPAAQVRASRQGSRWSGDAWLLYRPSAAGLPQPGPFIGRYGSSQAGAVLRYRLQPGGHRMALYARASSALAAVDRNLGLGLSARPISTVPVSVQAEVRVIENAGGRELAPAVLAVSEFAPLALPLRIRANAYLAGGYVGGSNHTPFIGGQVRADRLVARIAGAPVRVAGGAWGGAQHGAAALDVGPTVVADIPLARRRVSIELGYRWRVAGSAEPRSGAALVVSTGF